MATSLTETTSGFAATELDDGPIVLTEEMPGVRSASLGVWVRHGSAHEPPEEMGVSHLLEHMVFKGTRRRSAREIALVLERLGGSLDAYTTREHTGYLARVLDESQGTALDVLADLVRHPLLRPEDLELERRVVLEEIAMVEDAPDDLIFDLHARALWGDHPYGYTILGTRETVRTLDVATLARVHGETYHARNLVVAAAGNVRHGEVVERVRELFGEAPEGAAVPPVPPPQTPPPRREVRVARDAAQTHVVFGGRAFGHADPRREALALLCYAFGGGMSSRLFQRVREELGLAYTVFAHQELYRGAGSTTTYVATGHETADAATAVIYEELERLARSGLEAEELEDAKGHVKGQMALANESSGARLRRLGGLALYDEPYLTLEELVARVEAVTLEDVAALAAELFDPERQVVLRLGPE